MGFTSRRVTTRAQADELLVEEQYDSYKGRSGAEDKVKRILFPDWMEEWEGILAACQKARGHHQCHVARVGQVRRGNLRTRTLGQGREAGDGGEHARRGIPRLTLNPSAEGSGRERWTRTFRREPRRYASPYVAGSLLVLTTVGDRERS